MYVRVGVNCVCLTSEATRRPLGRRVTSVAGALTMSLLERGRRPTCVCMDVSVCGACRKDTKWVLTDGGSIKEGGRGRSKACRSKFLPPLALAPLICGVWWWWLNVPVCMCVYL